MIPSVRFNSHRLRTALLPALLLAAAGVQAQSFCASDGQPRPVALLERFINANCADCWTDPATPKTGKGQVALDWVVPGDKGDDAPLSAVATRDSLSRLDALKTTLPATASVVTQRARGVAGSRLRVAHGLPLAGYLGTSIELKPIPARAKKESWSAWLALVETLPAGTEGSPVQRQLVRNLLQTSWDGRQPLARGDTNRFFDARSMSIAEGVNPERVSVVGWVQDEQGRLLVAAQSRCVTP